MNNRKSKVKSKILLLIIIATLIAIVAGTYSRYTSTGTARTQATMAKWSITLKGDENEATDISSATATVETTAQTVAGVSNANVSDGKIAPGQTLVSTVEVDPTGSEVAIDYNLEAKNIVAEGFNNTSVIRVSKITATVDGGTETDLGTNDGKYVFFENLEDVLAGKKVTFKTYVLWVDGDNTADTQNGMNVSSVIVPVDITAKQHLAADRVITAKDADASKIEDVLPDVKAGETIQVIEDIDYSEVAKISGSKAGITLNLPDNSNLDLNNQTITVQNFSLGYQGNDITIKNGNITALPSSSYSMHIWDNDNASNGITVENVTNDGGICIYNAYGVVLKNLDVTAHQYYAVYGNVKTTITIESGTYRTTSDSTALFGYAKYDNSEPDEHGNPTYNPVDGFKIMGGTFYTNGKPLFLHATDHQNGIVYGGTFDCEVGEEYLAPGKTCTPNGSGMWVVN